MAVASEGPAEHDSADFPPELLALAPDSALNALLAGTDWPSTSLGGVETWPAQLRTAVGICLNSPFPMLIMWGADFAMIYNDAFVPILGAKHPALGLSCAVVWADAWPVVGAMIENVAASGESSYHEDLPLVIHRHGFDETVYFTFAYSAIPTTDRAVGGVFTVVTETTAQVLGTRRLQALRELGEARSAQVVDVAQACAAAIGVLSAYREDVTFAAVYLVEETGDRARVVASFGARPDLLPAVVHEGDGAWIWRAASDGVAHPQQASPETAMALPLTVSADDQPRGVLVVGISPHLVFDDAYRGFLDLAADHLGAAIADAHAQGTQLRRAEELAELDRAKTKFFTSVSHELRTPLTLIAGPAQDALTDRRAPLPPAQRARIEIVRRNAGRLRRMVDTLLDFSRIEDGRIAFEPVAVELGALTRGIAESFAPAVRRAGLEFAIDCPPDARPVLVDPGHWERIVLNLLSNAVKFTLAGTIGIALRIDGDRVELEVRDTGVGIEPGELPHIFERFRQVRGAAGRSHEGSGIGLALVRELAALHGGDADAVSRPGLGTTFLVRFPARHTDTPAVRAPANSVVADYVAEALQWSAPAENDSPATGSPPTTDTVLIAEDNADLRAYLSGLLQPEYTVVVAADGAEALDRARSLRPDLVLADVMMPRLDGLGLLRALRADQRTARTPVVFLSARAGEEAAAEGLAAGADDYLTKPFSSTDLLARVRSNLDQARLRNHESAWRTALVNAMQDGFFIADANLSIIEINDGFTRLLGYDAPELPWPVPHPWWPAADRDPDGAALVTAALEVVERVGRGRFVLPLYHRKGHRLWIDVSLDSLRDERSGAVLLVGTLRDVTGQHLAAERDATAGRLAGLLSGIDLSAKVLTVGLTELRDSWQAERVSLLNFAHPGTVTVTAGTDLRPGAPSIRGLAEYAGTGRLCVLSETGALTASVDAALVTAAGAPIYDGADQSMLWLEFARPRPFTDADRSLLVRLAGHMQRALTRARANDEQRTIALALQRALLGPDDLPEGFAARYEPAGSALEIGGDWYDVIALPGQRYGVVVGDVVGHGLPAATAMGQLRSAARALLLENNSPARVLTALDRFVEHLPGGYCATVFCATIDPSARTVCYSSAGHLPALMAEPGGTVQRLDRALSLPMAVRVGRERPEATIAVPDGATLLLYTDGLVERRDEDLEPAIARAAEILAEAALLPPRQALEHLCRRLLIEGHDDDIALLAYRQP